MNDKKVLAAYMRLSIEDNDNNKNNKSESNSINNQRNLINDYIANHSDLSDYEVIGFCDDGFSGTNFERPNIKKLLEKVKNGEIDTIIVKDFSRFGRNYLEVGDYLEQVFPFLGVRFISVNDNYDSIRDNGTAGIDIGLKNLIYDLYSKDLSIKIKSGKLSKMYKGEFIGGFAPYGYVKSKQQKNALIIDEEAAVIVKRIFQLATEGNSTLSIAKILNSDNILPPALHFKKIYSNNKFKNVTQTNKWNQQMVSRIIKNVTYLGKTVNHKSEVKEVGSRRITLIPQEEMIIIYNTHEPIISEMIFNKAQQIIKKHNKHKNEKTDQERLFYGKLKCGICKRAMIYHKVKIPYFKCNRKFYDGSEECFQGKTFEEDVESILSEAIRKQLQTLDTADKLLSQIEKQSDNEINVLSKNIQKLEQQIIKSEEYSFEQYEKYIDEQINKDEYFTIRDKINADIENIRVNITKLKSNHEIQLLKRQENKNRLLDNFKGYKNIEKLNNKLVDCLIDKIYIFDDKHIEIVWKFADEYEKVLELIMK